MGDDGYADTFEYKGCKYTRVDGDIINVFYTTEELPATVTGEKAIQARASDDPYAVIVYDAYDNQRKTTVGELMKEYEGWEKKYN